MYTTTRYYLSLTYTTTIYSSLNFMYTTTIYYSLVYVHNHNLLLFGLRTQPQFTTLWFYVHNHNLLLKFTYTTTRYYLSLTYTTTSCSTLELYIWTTICSVSLQLQFAGERYICKYNLLIEPPTLICSGALHMQIQFAQWASNFNLLGSITYANTICSVSLQL